MKVEVEIGQMHRFELREALLVYYGNQTTFITKHEVTTHREQLTREQKPKQDAENHEDREAFPLA